MCLNVCTLHVCSRRYPQYCAKCIVNGPPTTHQVSAKSVQPFLRYGKRGAHVQLCHTLHFRKTPKTPKTPFVKSHTKFQRNRSSRFRGTEKGTSARAHEQIRPTNDLFNMHRCSSQHQIWSPSAEPFLSYILATNFDTLHTARATCQRDPLNEPIMTAIKEA